MGLHIISFADSALRNDDYNAAVAEATTALAKMLHMRMFGSTFDHRISSVYRPYYVDGRKARGGWHRGS